LRETAVGIVAIAGGGLGGGTVFEGESGGTAEIVVGAVELAGELWGAVAIEIVADRF
jgi:hypothetical protein